jgi:DsbC/DsbD-like thiol-disulfide interchange protein
MFSNTRARLAIVLAASLTMTSLAVIAPAAAQGASQDASDWAPAPNSPATKARARLIASGGLEAGAYGAGVEIALSGQALTYWRNPGDAGVPPRFDFSGSRNLASVEVRYPAPERHDEGGAEAFGWRKGVIFPVTLRPVDPARPVILDLQLEYAACEEICVPSDAHLRFEFAPKAASGAQAGRIALWDARVPKPAPASAFAIARERAAPLPTWRVTPAQSGPDDDLFAEGPEGWFFETRRRDGHFTLAAVDRPASAGAQVEVRLTYRTASGATELQTRLDAASPAP